MRNILLAAIFFASTLMVIPQAEAYLLGSPHKPESDLRFHQIESSTGDVTYSQTGTASGVFTILPAATAGLNFHRVAKATYDFATYGGAKSAISLGVTLPAKSIITRSWINIVTQIVSSGSGTVALHCEDANNIKTATDMSGSAAGALIEGESTGAISAAKTSIAAACNITATIAGTGNNGSLTAGKFNAFVEYVVGD